MKKTGYNTENLGQLPWFNWGLNVSGAKDFFFVTGTCDYNHKGVIKNPNDPIGQTKQILAYMEEVFSQAGYTKQDIVAINWCVTKDVNPAQTMAILKVWEDYIDDLEVKPSGGTWKYIHALIDPGMMVELELILAR